MRRWTLLAVVAVLGLAPTVGAKRAIALNFAPPLDRLLGADVVVVGKVTAIQENVSLLPAQKELGDKIAVIKVESVLIGAANLTELKVCFFEPPDEPGLCPKIKRIPINDEFTDVVLYDGEEGVFFLCKHFSGEFFTVARTSTPVLTTDSDYKDQLALIKTGAAALTDPMKALRAEKAEDRALAAHVLVERYCCYPLGEVETSKLSTPESRAILKALAEANWQRDTKDPFRPYGFKSFERLRLTKKDGWTLPPFKDEDDEEACINKVKAAFAKWIDGAGKDYRIEKVVPKKGSQMTPPTPPQP